MAIPNGTNFEGAEILGEDSKKILSMTDGDFKTLMLDILDSPSYISDVVFPTDRKIDKRANIVINDIINATSMKALVGEGFIMLHEDLVKLGDYSELSELDDSRIDWGKGASALNKLFTAVGTISSVASVLAPILGLEAVILLATMAFKNIGKGVEGFGKGIGAAADGVGSFNEKTLKGLGEAGNKLITAFTDGASNVVNTISDLHRNWLKDNSARDMVKAKVREKNIHLDFLERYLESIDFSEGFDNSEEILQGAVTFVANALKDTKISYSLDDIEFHFIWNANTINKVKTQLEVKKENLILDLVQRICDATPDSALALDENMTAVLKESSLAFIGAYFDEMNKNLTRDGIKSLNGFQTAVLKANNGDWTGAIVSLITDSDLNVKVQKGITDSVVSTMELLNSPSFAITEDDLDRNMISDFLITSSVGFIDAYFNVMSENVKRSNSNDDLFSQISHAFGGDKIISGVATALSNLKGQETFEQKANKILANTSNTLIDLLLKNPIKESEIDTLIVKESIVDSSMNLLNMYFASLEPKLRVNASDFEAVDISNHFANIIKGTATSIGNALNNNFKLNTIEIDASSIKDGIIEGITNPIKEKVETIDFGSLSINQSFISDDTEIRKDTVEVLKSLSNTLASLQIAMVSLSQGSNTINNYNTYNQGSISSKINDSLE